MPKEPYELEPRYSTNEISGKCLKCLGEQELNNCLLQLLRDEGAGQDIHEKYDALVNFLQSPDFNMLREESEKYLAEGKKVSVIIKYENGQPVYRLKIY